MFTKLNLKTLNQIHTNNKLTITQLIGSLNFTKLKQTLQIITTLKSKSQFFISNNDYNNSYLPYFTYLKTYTTSYSIPHPLSYSYRRAINHFYSLCINKSKSLFHSIILSQYYNFTSEEIINFFSKVIPYLKI